MPRSRKGLTLPAFSELFEALSESPLLHPVALVLLTFAQEGAAILWGAYLVTEGTMGPALAAALLYVGMVASDLGIFALGYWARHLPWLRRYARDPRLTPLCDRLQANFLPMMVISRIIPGLLFPTYVACGLAGVGFGRFSAVTALISAVTLAILFPLALAGEETAFAALGSWGWIAIAAGAVLMVGLWRRFGAPRLKAAMRLAP